MSLFCKCDEKLQKLEQENQELREKLEHIEKLFPEGNPYRLRLPTFSELGVRKSYCCDCRFMLEGAAGTLCLAHPAAQSSTGKPQWYKAGMPDGLNAKHDCQHFQEKNHESLVPGAGMPHS